MLTLHVVYFLILKIFYLLIRFNNNESVVKSRNNQELDPDAGFEILKIFRDYPLNSSILDDLIFYETKEKNLLNSVEKKVKLKAENFANQNAHLVTEDLKDHYDDLGYSSSDEGISFKAKNTMHKDTDRDF